MNNVRGTHNTVTEILSNEETKAEHKRKTQLHKTHRTNERNNIFPEITDLTKLAKNYGIANQA